VATASEIITLVLDRLDEDPSNPQFWSRSELLVLLNEAYAEFNIIAIKLASTASITRPSANIIAIPPTAIVVMGAQVSSKSLSRTTMESMDMENRGWMKATGVPAQWGSAGINRMFFDKYPTASGATATITTLNVPQEIEEDTVIDLESEYLLALEQYVFHAARFKEGGAEFQQSMEAYQQFTMIAALGAEGQDSETFDLFGQATVAQTGQSYNTIGRG
jgi:hypothetical protein